jgi:hypothetical protein
MALLELVLQSTYFQQQCISRFNYISVGTPAAVSLSFALTSAFGCIYDPDGSPVGYPNPSVFWAIRNTQSTLVSYDFVTSKDVYSNTDFYETPFLQAALGLASNGDAMSPTVAMGYRTGRVRGDIRRGYKRFVGLGETAVNAGGVIGNSFLNGPMTICAGYLTQPLTYNDEGNIITFIPAIVKKERYLSNPAKDRYAYRYYESESEQLANVATGINFDPYPTQRTQTSRQYGRGR